MIWLVKSLVRESRSIVSFYLLRQDIQRFCAEQIVLILSCCTHLPSSDVTLVGGG